MMRRQRLTVFGSFRICSRDLIVKPLPLEQRLLLKLFGESCATQHVIMVSEI